MNMENHLLWEQAVEDEERISTRASDVPRQLEDEQRSGLQSVEQLTSQTQRNQTMCREPFIIDAPQYSCEYCGTLFWERQKNKNLSRKGRTIYTLCYHEGRVKLPPLADAPQRMTRIFYHILKGNWISRMGLATTRAQHVMLHDVLLGGSKSIDPNTKQTP